MLVNDRAEIFQTELRLTLSRAMWLAKDLLTLSTLMILSIEMI